MRRPPRPLSERRPARAHINADQLASLSHELRTPLNGVLGMARLLEGTQLSAEQRAYATALRESGQVTWVSGSGSAYGNGNGGSPPPAPMVAPALMFTSVSCAAEW